MDSDSDDDNWNVIRDKPVTFEQLFVSSSMDTVRSVPCWQLLQHATSYCLVIMRESRGSQHDCGSDLGSGNLFHGPRTLFEQVRQESREGEPGNWLMMLMIRSQEGNLSDLVDYVLNRSVAWHTNRNSFLFAAEIVHFYVRDRVNLVYMIADVPHRRRYQWPVSVFSIAEVAFRDRALILCEYAHRHWAWLRRLGPLLGRLMCFVRQLFDEAHYRPGGLEPMQPSTISKSTSANTSDSNSPSLARDHVFEPEIFNNSVISVLHFFFFESAFFGTES